MLRSIPSQKAILDHQAKTLIYTQYYSFSAWKNHHVLQKFHRGQPSKKFLFSFLIGEISFSNKP